MFKLDEINEKTKFKNKEKVAFVVFIFFCMVIVGLRVWAYYMFTLGVDQFKFTLKFLSIQE